MAGNIKLMGTTQAKVVNPTAAPRRAGQLILTSDSLRLFWDCADDRRVEITDFFLLADEASRLVLSSPISDKLYFVRSTGHLWVYSDGAWKDTTGDGVDIVIAVQQPAGQSAGDFWLEPLN